MPTGDEPQGEDGPQGEGRPQGHERQAPTPDRLTRLVTIVNQRGLHARAAARFVVTAERFSTPVEVSRDGETVSARSIMGLMMLGAGRGSRILLAADANGWDASEALDALAALVEAGFDERD